MRYTRTMSKSAKYPIRKLAYFTDEMAKAIDDFRYAHRIPSENEAIRQLIQSGIDLPRLCIDLLDAIEAKGLLKSGELAKPVAALEGYLGIHESGDIPQK